MINIKSKLILPALVITIAGAAVFSTASAFAQNQEGKYPEIVQKLVQKFGLKESDVKAVFDEVRQERQSEMQTRFEERLTQDVKDGKLTEAQKQAILAKHQELQAKQGIKPENWQNMTSEERRQARETQRQELEAWVKQNGIDLKYFFGGFGMRSGHWKGK